MIRLESHRWLFRVFVALAAMLAAVALALPPPALFEVSWSARDDLLADLAPAATAEALALEMVDIYHLDYNFDPLLNHATVRQEVRLFNRSRVALETLVFHLFPNLLGGDLTVTEAWIDASAAEFDYLPPQRSALSLPLPTPLPPGGTVVVSLRFDLSLPTGAATGYGLLGVRQGILSLAHGYALLAVHDGSDWDLDLPVASQGDLTHSEVAFYRVRVRVPEGLVMATSGVETSRLPSADGETVTFVAGPVRDFYLAASHDFVPLTRHVAGVTVRSFGHGSMVPAIQILDIAEAALPLLADRYGPYPYLEFDIVPLETSALGIEFPGIIALSTTLYGPEAPPGFLEGTAIHELAHQWFYGLVGSDQISAPWLDESLTQYATLMVFRDRYGSGGYRGFRDSLESRWERVGRREIPIGLSVDSYQGREYSAIIYGLGPLVLERLEERMGSATFATFLRDYVRDFRWQRVDTRLFAMTAEAACGCDLDNFFARWVLQ